MGYDSFGNQSGVEAGGHGGSGSCANPGLCRGGAAAGRVAPGARLCGYGKPRSPAPDNEVEISLASWGELHTTRLASPLCSVCQRDVMAGAGRAGRQGFGV